MRGSLKYTGKSLLYDFVLYGIHQGDRVHIFCFGEFWVCGDRDREADERRDEKKKVLGSVTCGLARPSHVDLAVVPFTPRAPLPPACWRASGWGGEAYSAGGRGCGQRR